MNNANNPTDLFEIRATRPELDALCDLIDNGCKHAGARVAMNAAVWLQKLTTAPKVEPIVLSAVPKTEV